MTAFRNRGPKATLLAFLLPGLALSLAAKAILPDPWSDVVFTGLWVATGLIGTRFYWARLDEAAREAQKSAYLWGGSLGMVAAFVALALAEPLHLTLPEPAETQPLALMIRGAVFVLAAHFIGFLVAWAIWWARRR